MVKILDFNLTPYYPKEGNGLEELIRFPDSEFKRENIPNGTVWVFNPSNHRFDQSILSNDVGCGMAAFIISPVDPVKSADMIYEYLNGKNILGRGNHFVDICSRISNRYLESKPHNILILHSDGKSIDDSTPDSIEEAVKKQALAEKFREELGYKLSEIIGATPRILGNWTHNSVEYDKGRIIYRKGAIKITSERLHLITGNLGTKVWFYTVDGSDVPPLCSMPHGTGRRGPRGDTKVSLKDASELRKMVHIPAGISDSSLRTEHPSCYNNFNNIINNLGDYIVSMGTSVILSYVGKT